jgi:hypothetical protein
MKGANAMVQRIRAIAKKFPDRVAKAQYQEAQIEMVEAKRRTPVSPSPAAKGVVPGTLRASGMVHEPERRGRSIKTTMSFGGPGSGAEDYAVIQHEELDYHHTVGQAKYLESVLDESVPYMAERIGRRIHFDKGGE